MRGLFGKALVVLCFGAVELYLLLIAFLRSGSNYGLRLFVFLFTRWGFCVGNGQADFELAAPALIGWCFFRRGGDIGVAE